MRLIITILTLIVSPHLFAQNSKLSQTQIENVNVKNDRVIWFNEVKQKALTGDLESIYILANKYLSGEKNLCAQNKKLSFDLFLYSANAGYKQSQERLITHYGNAARNDPNNSADLLAEACKWLIVSGHTIPEKGYISVGRANLVQISKTTREEAEKRARDFRANTNTDNAEIIKILTTSEIETLPQQVTPKDVRRPKA